MTGIAAVGKTTVLNELKELARESKVRVTILNFGTVMNEILRHLGKDMHRDEIRKQEMTIQKKAQELAANEIAQRAPDGNLVVDTHMFVRTQSGLWAGLPHDLLTKLKPCLLVLVEAPPEEISKRRRIDKTRMRDDSLKDEIGFDIQWSRSTASACAVLTGAPVRIIRNEPGMQREAARELLQIIREMGEA